MAHDRKSDPAMDNALERSLRESQDASGKDCAERSILAAYFDHELPTAETARWETHFSACARCQEQLAVLARTESALPQVQPVGQPGAWRRFWTLRWVAPLATAAAAVALWVAIRPAPPTEIPRQVAVTPQLSEKNRRDAGAPPPAEAQPPASSSQATNRGVAEVNQLDKAKKPALADANASAPPPVKPTPDRLKTDAAKTPDLEIAERKSATGDEKLAFKTAAPHAQVAAAPSGVEGRMNAQTRREAADEKKSAEFPAVATQQKTPAEHAQKMPAADLAQKAEMKEKPRDGSAAFKTGTTDAAAEKQEESQLAAGLRKGQAVSGRLGVLKLDNGQVLVRPPVRDVAWRLGAQGLIEKSTDAGKTWTRQSSPVSADLLSGSAPSGKVCWVVGTAGTVLRTVDGEHWEKVSSPATADLQSISARDQRSAVVLAADGKTYVTSDGGRTWRLQ